MHQKGFDLTITQRRAQRPADAAREHLGFDVSPYTGACERGQEQETWREGAPK
jgi:hypothetical protein